MVLSGAMSAPPPRTLTILSRPDCHLCTVVDKMAQRLAPDWQLLVEKRDVDSDPEWQRRYGASIPVVLLDGEALCAGRITEGDLRRALERSHLTVDRKSARERGPISRILSRLGLATRRGRSFL